VVPFLTSTIFPFRTLRALVRMTPPAAGSARLERDRQKWNPVLRRIALQPRKRNRDPIQLDRITV
jgi:hypothetical protein